MSTAIAMPLETVPEAIHRYLRRRYGELRHAPVKLARAASATPRAARNWLDGECSLRSDNLVELMAADPDFEAAVLEIVRVKRAQKGGA
jgi:hypothetical protein